MTEKKITICGKEVRMIYCAATENGYESISGKRIDVFIPTTETDDDGKERLIPSTATIGDYMSLALAGIIAAYAKDNQDPPITANDILYDATSDERNILITSIIELRAEWYGVPKVVTEVLSEEAKKMKHEPGDSDKRKNA